MSDQQYQAESQGFRPSRLNRVFAKIHIAISAAVLASTIFLVFRIEIAIARSETGDFAPLAVHLLAGFIGLFAFGMLLLLIKCVRNLTRPTARGERITAWMMFFYFLLLSLIYWGQLSGLLYKEDLLYVILAYHFWGAVIGFVTSMARIFSLPSREEQGRKESTGHLGSAIKS